MVTGASSGLGRGFATTLADAGATVFAAARRLDHLEALAERPTPGSIVPVRCDVMNADDRNDLVRSARAATGHLDILINNAGIAGPLRAEDETAEGFERTLSMNLAAAFHLTKSAAKHHAADRSMSIINVGSVVGLVSTAPVGGAGYAASKAGLMGLTRELAGQWGRRQIRVNAVVPGWFDTEMTNGLFLDEKSQSWVGRNTMLGRPGDQGEVDGAVLFLASDASSYVTGHALVVDGGWTAR